MGILIWARTLAQALWEKRLLAYAAVRIGALRARTALLGLSETVREQFWHWRGKSVVFPVEEQRGLLAEYYERFERLAELICDAAFAGTGAPFQSEYAQLRGWLQRAYPALKPYLTAHMNTDPSDAEFGIRVAGTPADAMEALFLAETLDELLQHDQGDLISRLERARSALYRYADYLRTLS